MDTKYFNSLGNITPSFRIRVEETWKNFAKYEALLRSMLDAYGDPTDIKNLVRKCLEPAFTNPSFALRVTESKYTLILTAESLEAFAYELLYFKSKALPQIVEHWNIVIGRMPSNPEEDGAYHIGGISMYLHHLQFSVQIDDNNDLQIQIYSPDIPVELARHVKHGMIEECLVCALGEVPYTRFINNFHLSDESIPTDQLFSYDEFISFLKLKVRHDIWDETKEYDYILSDLHSFSRNRPNVEDGKWHFREEITSIMTATMYFEVAYVTKDVSLIEPFFNKGIVPGFLILDTRDTNYSEFKESLDHILKAVDQDVYTVVGYAVGSYFYIDLLIWDIKAFLTQIEVACHNSDRIKAVLFKVFTADDEPLVIKPYNSNME